MGNLIDKLRESGNTLTETADYIEKSTKLASYWLDSEKRQQINRQAEYWRKKESRMIKTYIILWILMIVLTTVLCFKVI